MVDSVVQALDLPFGEAVAYMLQRDGILPTTSYRDINRENQQYALGIAGLEDAKAIADFKGALDRFVSQGGSRQEFEAEFDRIAKDAGWDYRPVNVRAGQPGATLEEIRAYRPFRTNIIAMQNFLSAFGEGRKKQLEEFADEFPYLEILPSIAREPRADHKRFDGLILRRDDPFWQAYGYPPWGYSCSHRVRGVTRQQLEREGREPDQVEVEYQQLRDKVTGEVTTVPLGLTPQFLVANRSKERILDNQLNLLPAPLVAALAAVGIRTSQPLPVVQPEEESQLSKFAGFQFQALTAAAINTALDVARLKFSTNRKVAFRQLIERGVFNFALANIVGFGTKDLGVPLSLGAQLLFSGYGLTETGKLFQKGLHKGGAEQIRQKFGQEKIDQLKLKLSERKVNQKTFIFPGLQDTEGLIAKQIAQDLIDGGLEGKVKPFANPSFFDGETKGDFAELLRQTYLKYCDVSQDFAEQIIADLLDDGQINKINLIGHSSGANIAENLAGILNELGIEVDDIVTWGSEGLPPSIGENTRLRRYFSDKDIFQILRIPEPNASDRFFEGVFHSDAEFRFFNIPVDQPLWNTSADVRDAAVADLNQFLEKPQTDPNRLLPSRTLDQIKLEQDLIKERVGIITPEQIKQVATGPIVTQPPKVPLALPKPAEVIVRGVELNTASIADLLYKLPLTTRQAASLKRYIKANGPIRTLDDLAKVPDFGSKTLADLQSVPPVVVNVPRNVAEMRRLLETVKGVNRDKLAADLFAEMQANGPYNGVEDLRQRLRKMKGMGPRTIEKLVETGLATPLIQPRQTRQPIVTPPPIELGDPQIFPTDPNLPPAPVPPRPDIPLNATLDDIRQRIQTLKGINREAVAQAIFEDIQANGLYLSEADLRQRMKAVRGVGAKTVDRLIETGLVSPPAQPDPVLPITPVPPPLPTLDDIRQRIQTVRGINRDAVAEAILADIQANGPYVSEEDLRRRMKAVRGVGVKTVDRLIETGLITGGN